MSDSSDKNNPTRRDFLKQAFAGSIGTVLTSFGWPGKAIAENSRSGALNNIAFGSCAKQDKPQPIWDGILDHNPDLFLFLGDNIYGDTKDMPILQKKYDKLAAKLGYQRLLDTCPILATWDDHDYGQNDAGVQYSKKKESERIFLDFFNISEDSKRRKRPGIYGSYMFGPPGKRTQIILLDTRYFKDTSGRKKNKMSKAEKEKQNLVGWYLPTEDSSATLLGEQQWAWLEDELKKEADVRIIGSSVQVVAYEKGMESWGNYPHERDRLFKLIRKTGANAIIFVSGDVHFSELSKTNEGPYPLYDFTSSGMTHSNQSWAQAVNNFRIGQAYSGHNAGLINIDWDKRELMLRTLTTEGSVAQENRIKLDELSV